MYKTNIDESISLTKHAVLTIFFEDGDSKRERISKFFETPLFVFKGF
jgi:hypothetical protein